MMPQMNSTLAQMLMARAGKMAPQVTNTPALMPAPQAEPVAGIMDNRMQRPDGRGLGSMIGAPARALAGATKGSPIGWPLRTLTRASPILNGTLGSALSRIIPTQ